MAFVLKVNGNTARPQGTEGHSTFALNATIALAPTTTDGVTSLRYQVVVPPGSTAVLGTETPVFPYTTTFGPLDVHGTYIITAIPNGDVEASTSWAVTVLATNGLRLIGPGETSEWDGQYWWFKALNQAITDITVGGGGVTSADLDAVIGSVVGGIAVRGDSGSPVWQQLPSLSLDPGKVLHAPDGGDAIPTWDYVGWDSLPNITTGDFTSVGNVGKFIYLQSAGVLGMILDIPVTNISAALDSPTRIGGTTPNFGTFTAVGCTSFGISGGDATKVLRGDGSAGSVPVAALTSPLTTPPVIGGTTPAAGTFTALGGSSLSLSGSDANHIVDGTGARVASVPAAALVTPLASPPTIGFTATSDIYATSLRTTLLRPTVGGGSGGQLSFGTANAPLVTGVNIGTAEEAFGTIVLQTSSGTPTDYTLHTRNNGTDAGGVSGCVHYIKNATGFAITIRSAAGTGQVLPIGKSAIAVSTDTDWFLIVGA